ncbi:hypothetical protein SAMN04487818_108351 [Actinokineospora terrae]|uniref:Uncharacterized protein n=1 Tax=Actinokineospora terrae TaxID=155974 RepID=A0A1H9VGU6_9PSEU|nr:hypothetical protein SAMN04487818_108351 [Actinokineospora terrae]
MDTCLACWHAGEGDTVHCEKCPCCKVCKEHRMAGCPLCED